MRSNVFIENIISMTIHFYQEVIGASDFFLFGHCKNELYSSSTTKEFLYILMLSLPHFVETNEIKEG